MKLSAHDTEHFYRIWWPLLRYVNAQCQIVPELPTMPGRETLSREDAHQIRQALWESDSLLESFIDENPANLTATDLHIVASWRDRVAGQFFILRYLKKYTVFLTQEKPPLAYGVLGLASPIEEILPLPLPVFVNAVLLPFEEKITYDSLLVPYSVRFGRHFRSDLNEAYREAQERGGIIRTLQPRSQEEIQQSIYSGNQKILAVFRRDLAASGLSFKMIKHHADMIQRFMESYLSAPGQPRSLLDLNTSDLQNYLSGKGKNANPVSFKRLVRFLVNTGRIDWHTAQEMQDFLKQRKRRSASKS
jgi:hypothetical protein